ncbi:MAG: Crp/Fnr family transcriptional regulator [Oscillospiraceae bacterium]|nr:Crp/Fnr family transcriptional regulator [Oscillospiraceae bacterium]
MKKYFEILRKCPLFAEIKNEDLIPLLDCLRAEVKSYRKKDVIILEGEAARCIGIVLSGSVQIEISDYYGNRTILSTAEPSELFGESFACAEVKSIPINVVASENCEVMLIDCRRVMHSCTNACNFHSQMIFNLMRIVALKNIVFHQKIEIISKRSTREKLMAYLMFQAKRAKQSRFEIPFDRQELADYLGVDRSGLSNEISKLTAEGVLKSKKNYFELL